MKIFALIGFCNLILAQPLRQILGMGHRGDALGIDSLHFGDQIKNSGKLRAGGFDFRFAHRQPG